ncbi:MAG TPA: polysaccharide deacetylase family protein [Gemmatimonadales bacterium]|nr:polysaccharide deacetylase family protein [Gemmatimonadales bacterium]
MPPILPPPARRQMLATWRRTASSSRRATGALTILAALAPTVPLALGVSIPSGGLAGSARSGVAGTPSPSSPPGPTGGPGAGPPGPRSGAVSYRIVGCRSRGAVAYQHGPQRREVAIGFDDGPWSDTPGFVRMLERSHARATFFMIGEQLNASYRSTLMRELRDGDVLGDHTFTHPYLTRSGNVYGQLRATIVAIRALTGYTPCVFRPPYGAYDGGVVRTAASLGLATVLWNVDPSDYARPGSSAIVRRVLSQVRPGSIIISHDGGGPRTETLAAYPSIIAALRGRGYRVVTIPELLGFRPVYTPCIQLCDGIGVPRSELSRDAIIQRAP